MFVGMGTLINCCGVILGGGLGLVFGRFLNESMQKTVLMASGISVMVIGIGGTMQEMLVLIDSNLRTTGTMMMITSLCLGSLIGEYLNIQGNIEKFAAWLKRKTGNVNDVQFIDAFLSASLTICIGAMAVIGAIQDGIADDYSILTAKAFLDCIIILIMTASLGKGCLFSVIPVGIFQGTITIFATFIQPFMTKEALANISLVGSVIIICVGINLIWGSMIRVANMLPALVLCGLFAFLPI